MAEESGTAPNRLAESVADPVVGLPKAARPVNVALGLGLVYLAGAACAGTTLIALTWRRPEEGVALWAIAGAILGLPLTGLLAWVGARAERVLTGHRPPSRWLWVPFAWGVAMSAHWAPLCPWAFALWGAALVHSGRAEHYLASSLVALVAWAGVALGMAALVPVSRALFRRRWLAGAATVGLAGRVPTSSLVGGVYLLAVSMPSVLWIAWLQDEAARSSGAVGLAAWTLLGAAAAAGAGAAYATWLRRVASVPSLRDAPRRGEVAGAVAAAHWLPAFTIALTPMLRDELRYATLAIGFVAVLSGTALWSGARAARLSAAS